MSSNSFTPAFLKKIVSRTEILQATAQLAKPLVFTNGVFDVLHRGHVSYLAQAKSLGASLVVALNSDASAKRLGKGPDRPLNNELDRAIMMASLESVDLVTWFDEDTPLKIIQEIKPNILVKGGDYNMSQLKEGQWIEANGGKAFALSFIEGYSTTQLIKKIRSS